MALVQESNWSKSDVKPGDDVGDLVCPKHRCNGQGRKSILVHVIDGFVIEESNVPFQEDAVIEEEVPEVIPPPRIFNQTIFEEVGTENEPDQNTWSPELHNQQEEPHVPVIPTNCKFCGGPLPPERAYWGKRFCSVSCGKRYSVGCSFRVRRALQNKVVTVSRGSRGRGFRRFGRGRGARRLSASSVQSPQNTTEVPFPDVLPDMRYDQPYPFPYRIDGLDENDLEEDLFDGIEPMMKYATAPSVRWTVTDVVDFVSSIPGCHQYVDRFIFEEIDGQALMLLKEEHMIQTMGIKLGPALKIASRLRMLKSQFGIKYRTKYLGSPVR